MIRYFAYSVVDVLHKALKPGLAQKTCIDKGRKAIREWGYECNPVGVGNTKTELPGSYRRVGVTCPDSCSLLGRGCYAQKGHVNIAQKRATPEVYKDIAAAGLAMATAWFSGSDPARLHISGDFAKDNDVDEDYVYGLICLAEAMEEKDWFFEHPDDEVGKTKAYAYTHLHQIVFSKSAKRLKDFGIYVRWSSDEPVPNGAIVVDTWNDFYRLKAEYANRPEIKLFRCREQLDGTPCRVCKLCWDSKTEDHCVVFKKH